MNMNRINDIGVAVIGGGNIGTQFACKCASKGYKVNICSSKADLYDGLLEIIDENNNLTVGKVNKVTSDIGNAIRNCKIIFVTYPAFCFPKLANQMLPFIEKGMKICVLPGTGGAEFAFRECIKRGAILYGLQRVPSVARIEKYGKRVRCEGLRKELYLAAIPNLDLENMADFMANLWEIPCKTLPNYLNVTLTPSNQILHTTRLRTLFADYEKGKIYNKNPNRNLKK